MNLASRPQENFLRSHDSRPAGSSAQSAWNQSLRFDQKLLSSITGIGELLLLVYFVGGCAVKVEHATRWYRRWGYTWCRSRCGRATGIETSEHATAIHLAHDRCLLCATGIVWRHATGGSHATVGVCRHHTTFAVDGHIVKVEQVSIIPAGQATKTNRSLLDRIARCCVNG